MPPAREKPACTSGVAAGGMCVLNRRMTARAAKATAFAAAIALSPACQQGAYAFQMPSCGRPVRWRGASMVSAPETRVGKAGVQRPADGGPATGLYYGAEGGSGPDLSLGTRLRRDFPILHQEVFDGKPLVYLDSAATSQKPRAVLEALEGYYQRDNSNVHRGAHALSARATEAYEAARDKVRAFVNAGSRREIIFTRGATEAINLVASTWGEENIGEGDEIVLTVMEHHSNIVPWQLLAERKKAVLKFAQLSEDMSLDVDHLVSLITPKTKLVSMVHVSNALGGVNPVKEAVEAARVVGARVLVDGCQSVPNMPVDVQELGVDWLAASGHKMCGPTGIGFLYGRLDVLESMPPWQGGGEMIDEVFLDRSTFAPPPARFEAGTPAIAQAVGLGAACDYLSGIGMDKIAAYEHALGRYLWDQVKAIEGLTLYGQPPNAAGDNRNPLVSFNSADVHAHDLSFFLDQEGVAIRAGHHCAQPLHRQLGAAGSLRASCYLYNTVEDVDRFIAALKTTLDFFGGLGGSGEGQPVDLLV